MHRATVANAAEAVRILRREMQTQLELSSCEPTPAVVACAQRIKAVATLARRGGYLDALAAELHAKP